MHIFHCDLFWIHSCNFSASTPTHIVKSSLSIFLDDILFFIFSNYLYFVCLNMSFLSFILLQHLQILFSFMIVNLFCKKASFQYIFIWPSSCEFLFTIYLRLSSYPIFTPFTILLYPVLYCVCNFTLYAYLSFFGPLCKFLDFNNLPFFK